MVWRCHLLGVASYWALPWPGRGGTRRTLRKPGNPGRMGGRLPGFPRFPRIRPIVSLTSAPPFYARRGSDVSSNKLPQTILSSWIHPFVNLALSSSNGHSPKTPKRAPPTTNEFHGTCISLTSKWILSTMYLCLNWGVTCFCWNVDFF